jgi:hypothetical protein
MSAYGTSNKITFNFFTLKGANDAPRRIVINYNGNFPIEKNQIGWGIDDLTASLCALKHEAYLHQEYKQKYFDLLKRLNDSGFILRESIKEDERD